MEQNTVVASDLRASAQQLVDDLGPCDIWICESFGTSHVEIVQPPVVNAQLMEDGRMQIRYADPVLNGSVAKFIRRSIGQAGMESTTSH